MAAAFDPAAFDFGAFEVVSPEISSAYARMMMSLLPPGRLWRRVGSVLEKLMLACADELARVDSRVGNLLREADPSTATELLPEYERELGLDRASTLGERRARIIGRLVARQRYRPADFKLALSALLGQDTADVDVRERTHAFAVSIGDVREIFRFFIYRDPTLPGTYYLDSAQDLVDQMKPSHTAGHVIESVVFRTGDPYSLLGRDLLGPDV